MRNGKTPKWLACIGLVGVVGAGTAVGLVGSAGAVSGSSKVAAHGSGAPVTTASFTFSVAVSGLTPSPVDVTGSGQADLATPRRRCRWTFPAVGAKVLPGGSAAPETVRAVYAGGTVYLNDPSLSSLVGKPWISVALPSSAATSASGIFSKVAAGLGDVDTIVQRAATHHATVTPLGSSVVDGVSVTGDKIATTLRNGRGTVTASLWANSSDQLVQANVDLTSATKKHDLGITATLNLSGYGDPVSITVPSTAEVKSIPFSTVGSLLGSFLAKGGHAGHGRHHGHGLRLFHGLHLFGGLHLRHRLHLLIAHRV